MLEFDLPRSRKEKRMIPIDGGKNPSLKLQVILFTKYESFARHHSFSVTSRRHFHDSLSTLSHFAHAHYIFTTGD